MSETAFFDCVDCKHRVPAASPIWSRCNHIAVEEMEFEGSGIETFTDEDFIRLGYLVNNRLRLKMVNYGVNKTVPNFDFPFQYEPVHITSCGGYEIKEYSNPRIWKSGDN